MTDFRLAVLAWVRQIPWGQVATYGQIARLAGNPRAARQVGRILYQVSQPELPWQRVINAQGQISTYGLGHGEEQRALLEAEGIVFDPQGRCSLKRFQWKK